MNHCYWKTIPRELTLEVLSFLSGRESHCLYKSSQSVFTDLEYEQRKIRINTKTTQTFLKNKDYQQYVLSKIKDPEEQLEIQVETIGKMVDHLLSLPAYALNINRVCVSDPLLLTDHKYLKFASCIQSELKGFKNLASFHVKDSEKLQKLHNLPNLEELFVSNCPLLNEICCSLKLRKLSLQNLISLKMVKYFKSENGQETEILSTCEYLQIYGCERVEKVEKLMINARRVETNYSNLINLTQLSKIKHLSLSFHLWGLPMAMLSKLFELTLHGCNRISSLKGLSKIPVLRIFYCSNLKDISDLSAHNQSVSISYCHQVVDYRPLRNIHHNINISAQEKFNDAHDVINATTVTLQDCPNLVDVTMLSNVQNFTLHSMQGISCLAGLHSLCAICISFCLRITSIAEIDGCKKIVLVGQRPEIIHTLPNLNEYHKTVINNHQKQIVLLLKNP
jgi:hypothetical protein